MPAIQPDQPIAAARRPLPFSWRVLREAVDGRAVVQRGLHVIETLHREADGRRWHHVSLSRPGRLPTYEDVLLVRRLFIGEKVECYQVFPPAARHVNVHPYCLHLWRCLDAPDGVVLPDFRHGGQV